jgi:hypothetical protein
MTAETAHQPDSTAIIMLRQSDWSAAQTKRGRRRGASTYKTFLSFRSPQSSLRHFWLDAYTRLNALPNGYLQDADFARHRRCGRAKCGATLDAGTGTGLSVEHQFVGLCSSTGAVLLSPETKWIHLPVRRLAFPVSYTGQSK